MATTSWLARNLIVNAMLLALAACLGCHACSTCGTSPDGAVPRELTMVSLPPYVIEPPDILILDALNLVPKPPYRIGPLDSLLVQADIPAPKEPVSGIFTVEPEGTINLGTAYGSVSVAGLTLDQARIAIEQHLRKFVKNVTATVALAQTRLMEQIRGEHLVYQDGTIDLGTYGTVSVVGLTIAQAKTAIEKHLSQYLMDPNLSVSMGGFNSKTYYVIFDGAGYGQTIYRLPITGKETVLDAVAQLNGLPPYASLDKIRLVRPSPSSLCCDQVLPVDWNGITKRGETATNYQVLPGDRIYVGPDNLMRTTNWIAKFVAPIEQVLGVTLLGSETVHSVRNGGTNNGTGNGVGGF